MAALRTDERGTDPRLAGSADLPVLVDEYRRAGLEVTAHVAADAGAIEGPVGTALHRIAREALANVARHAAGNRVVVTRRAPLMGRLHLPVADHGQAPAARATVSAEHFGLVGMRERARALGGELEAGPTPDGWQVRCAPAPVPARVHDDAGAVVIRVLIVDDQPVVRAGVARILGPDDGFEVVAECDDGDEVVDAVGDHQPRCGADGRAHAAGRRGDGHRAAARARATSRRSSCSRPSTTTTPSGARSTPGAAGFVLKDAAAEDLIAAARAVAGGAAWLDPKVAARVLGAVRTRGRAARRRRARGSTSSPSGSTTCFVTWRVAPPTPRSPRR